jgi:serine/threonine protein kinase
MSVEKIGRYEVRREIGRGGMATIYAAHDPLFNREVAIKMLPVELLQDPNFRARFQREAQVIAALEHPAIVPVYDFGEENGQPYFVMRLMLGNSLAERLAEGPLSLPEVAYIISRIAPALDQAHQKGIIHRDLKPANILFDQNGEPYLSDFGIAKLSEATTTLTGNTIVGTPAYMSPEQGRGETDIDGRSDLYALGAIYYEMLTGQLPYEADSPTGLVLKHITAPIPNILAANPGLPPECQEIIVRSMAKRKFARFSKATEMAAAIEAIVDGSPMPLRGFVPTIALEPNAVTEGVKKSPTPQSGAARGKTPLPKRNTPQPARRPSTPGRTLEQPVARRSPAWVGLLVGLVVVGVILAGGGLLAIRFLPDLLAPGTPTALAVTKPSATPPEAADVSTFTNADAATSTSEPTLTATLPPQPTDTSAPATDTPLPPTATLTPAPVGPIIGGADKVAFIKENEVWVANLDGSDTQQLTASGGIKSDPQWTPDGNAITYIRGKCVEMVTLDTPPAISQILCASWASYLAAFEISPDGKQVALSLSDGLFIYAYDLNLLGQIRRQDQLESVEHCMAYTKTKTRTVRWSNDSRQVAVIGIGTQGGKQVEMVRVMDVSQCDPTLKAIEEFPGARFTLRGYDKDPRLEVMEWDGDALFVVGINSLNGYGEAYLYNMFSLSLEQLKPLGNNCCFRDFRWSPDNNYLLFAFQDNRYMRETKLYLIDFNTLGSGAEYLPIALPDAFFTQRLEQPQAVLRPVRP